MVQEVGSTPLNFDQQLANRLERLRKAAGFDQQKLLAILRCTPDEHAQILAGTRNYSIASLQSACDAFLISLDALMENSIDLDTIAAQFQQDARSVPERYLDQQAYLTSARPIVSAVKWIDSLFGPSVSDTLLRRIQVRRCYFESPEKRIHPFLIGDFFSEMYHAGIHASQAFEIGKSSADLDATSNVGRLLSKASSTKDLYSRLHDGILSTNFDKIFEYQPIRITSSGLKMRASPRSTAYDLLNGTVFGNSTLCLYRQGVYVAFAAHYQPRLPSVTKTSCVYAGDSKCTFHLTWAN